MHKKSAFIEKGLSFFVPFLGLIWFFKNKNRGINLIGFFVNLLLCGIIIFGLIQCCSLLQSHISFIGKKPICNLKEERAMHFGSFVFILCYRCTFLILGSISAFLFSYLKKMKLSWYLLSMSILCILPCFVDGVLQLTTSYVSTNIVRAISGLCAGFGIGYILYIPFKKWNLFL